MDDRQTQVRQGEGLSESRVNQEFIDFLNKWSSPVLMVLAVAALSWAGLQWMQTKKIEKVNRAFSDLDAALVGGNPSPDSLKTLATEYKGVRAVPEMALLQTADVYLGAFVRGVEPGAQADSATGEPDPTAFLDDAQRATYLDHAGQLAQQVLDLSADDEGKAMLAIHALIRLAAVNEGKRDFDGAKAFYTRASERAIAAGYPVLARFAQNRASGIEGLDQTQTLPADADLIALPGEEPMDLDALNAIINSTNPSVDADPAAQDTDDADTDLETDPADSTQSDSTSDTPDEPAAEPANEDPESP